MGNKGEMKTVLMLLVGCFVLLGIRLYPEAISNIYHPENFLSLHILLELFSVSVAFAIIIQGWMIFIHTLSRHRLFISALFLCIGIIDTLHILTYKNMPFFLVENSVQNATWFWIISRLTLSIGLLLIFSFKDKTVNKQTRVVSFILSFVYTAIIGIFVLFLPDALPPLINEGKGLTPLKISFEYFISFLFLCLIIIMINRYRKSRNSAYLALIAAIGFSLLAELIFTLYRHVYDFENLLGHIFKVISYYFLLKGIYSQTIEEPFLKQKEMQKALSESENRLNTIFRLVPTGITITDTNGQITYANRAAEQILEVSSQELLSRNVKDSAWDLRTIDGEDFPEDQQNFQVVSTRKEEIKGVLCSINGKDGNKKILSVNSSPVFDEKNEVVQVINSLSDMTDLMQAQEKINYLAYHDELTGLPNRYYFKEQCDLRMDKDLAILLINLNRFKNVNDSLGNDIGDVFLKTVASRLEEFTKDVGGLTARLGGDEFGFLLEGYKGTHSIIKLAQNISKRLQEPMKAKGFTFHIDASIGIAINSNDVKEEEQLFQQANIALHEAKRNSQAYMVFNPKMNEERYENIILENELRQAIERNHLTLYYQPQLNIQTGKVIGVEALIRWMHPERGMISPGKFIPLAEESGLIVPIGKWVLQEACRQIKIWHDKGLTKKRISVNLSLRQFFQDDLVETVANALQESELDPQYLELEITESLAMNVERAIILLKRLKELGVRIAIDDFGTGYSSFSYLHQLPIDQLKIDQSFIQNLSKDANNEAIVETIITMGHHLRLDLIAEGVETEEQLKFLHRNRCNGIQGYLISRPLPAKEIEPLLWEKEKNSFEEQNS